MPPTLLPGLLDRLLKLPGEEAFTESSANRLRLAGALVVTESVVSEAERLREHPAFAIVLVKEGSETDLLQLLESDLGQDGVAEFGIERLVDTPETFGV